MKIELRKSSLTGEIAAPASKSYVQRAIIAAALSESKTEISANVGSDDVGAAVETARALGAEVIKTDGGMTVLPNRTERGGEINCFDSAAVLRIAEPLFCALGEKVGLRCGKSLLSRPSAEFIEVLRRRGAAIIKRNYGFATDGRLTCGEFRFGKIPTSQYITGLLFSLPLLRGDSRIIYDKTALPSGYAAMTAEVLGSFGIDVVSTDYGYYVRGGQSYKSPRKFTVEGDWSLSANWLVGAAVGGEVTVSGLNARSLQPDAYITDILRKANVCCSVLDDKVRVTAGDVKPFDCDANATVDIVPVCAVLAACADGTSRFRNVSRLAVKESNRVRSVIGLLSRFGVRSELVVDDLFVHGKGRFDNAVTDGCNDHRIVMASAIAALRADRTVIEGCEAVKKSYPDFFADYEFLGGKTECR